jgi:superfamily II DNA or RNA helicase
MAKRLSRTKIPFASFTGRLNDKEKSNIIKKYNTGKIKHLLISGAGAEGLDLKGTRLLQIMEPHWNEPMLKQIKGRVKRFKSHTHLPKKERNITIQTYINKPRKTRWLKKQHSGTDEYLELLSKNKQNLVSDFTNVLKRVGSAK